MASSLAGTATGANLSIAPATTCYAVVGSSRFLTAMTTETNVAATARSAGTFSKLSVNARSNTLSTAATTFRFRKNGANGNQSVAISASTTGVFEDTSNSDSVSDGDTFDYSIVTDAGGTGAINPKIIFCNFDATSDTVTVMGCCTSSTISTASVTRYAGVAAGADITVTAEASTQIKMKTGGTFKKMRLYVSSNARTSDTTFRLRKNTANGNQTITLTASTTGWFEDTSNTDTVTTDDLVNYSITTGTGGSSLIVDSIVSDYVTTDNTSEMVSGNIGGITLTAGTTYYFPPLGHLTTGFTTENAATYNANFATTLSKMRVYVSANASTANGTVTLRKNTADGTQTFTVTSGTTGFFEDSSGTDSITSGDDVCMKFVSGTGGTTTCRYMSLTSTVAGGSPPAFIPKVSMFF